MKKIFYLFTLLSSFSIIYAQEKQLTVEESMSDFQFLCEKIEIIHPNPDNPAKLAEHKKSIIQELQNKEITIEDFYMLTAPYLASISDGHSNMLPPVTESRIQYLDSGGLTLPLKLTLSNGVLIVDGVLIDSTQTAISKGDTVTSINSISNDSISSFLYNLVGSENNNYIKDTYINSMLSTLLWYKYQWGDTFLFETHKSNGETKTEIMHGITREAALHSQSKISPATNKEKYEMKIDSLSGECQLNIRTFSDPKSLSLFLDKSFKDIKENEIKNLTIDLRDNGGGASAAVDSLVFHLTSQPFRLYCNVLLKVSPDVKALYKNKYPDIFNNINQIVDGGIYKIETPIIRSDKEYIYKGGLTVLCNEKTYSGASTFVSLVKSMSLGKVIGHTGQNKIYYADHLFLKLPHSHINFTVSMKEFEDC